MKTIYLLLPLFFLTCQSPEIRIFRHTLSSGPTPWTHSDFDQAIDRFSFAIVSDLYGGEREGIFQVAINQLQLLKPELVLSVGDLIDGGTEDRGQLKMEWDRFDEYVSQLDAPFFYIGGNHDLTNKVMREVWRERYGPRYYHFIYKNVLFLMLDSEDFSEERMQEIYLARAEALKVMDGPATEKAQEMEYFKMPERVYGEISDTQSGYFEWIIEQYPNVKWTFILMHKPVWQREDDLGLIRIENALADRSFTVINGHLHAYSYHNLNDRDYMILGTTSGSQNPENESSYDHITWVTMTSDGPSIANLKLEGILDKTGIVPGATEDMCFQVAKCD